MKILSRQDFLRLPKGIIYCRTDSEDADVRWRFSSIMVKGETIYEENGEAVD